MSRRLLSWFLRALLAGIFLFFGSNLIFSFMAVPLPAGAAGQFRATMASSGYLKTVGVFQVLGGLMLLFDAGVPLGLVLLGPVIVNIVLYHLHFHVPGISLAMLCVGCEGGLLWLYRGRFVGLFRQHPSLAPPDDAGER